MEQKLVRVPFDVEQAKKIQNKEIEGRIVTADGRAARIADFNLKEEGFPLLVIADDSDGGELYYSCDMEGKVGHRNESTANLMLEIPEYMTFKDGDILISGDDNPFIYKDEKGRHGCVSAYFGIDKVGNEFFDSQDWTHNIKGKADETQCKVLIDALKASKEPIAKEYLKRFFGIEKKKEYEFKPFDKVLVRDNNSEEWMIDFFGRAIIDKEDNLPYKYEGICGAAWLCCIPYNEQTAHLLGTADDWEGE